MSKYNTLPFSKHDEKEDPAITSLIAVLYQYFNKSLQMGSPNTYKKKKHGTVKPILFSFHTGLEKLEYWLANHLPLTVETFHRYQSLKGQHEQSLWVETLVLVPEN